MSGHYILKYLQIVMNKSLHFQVNWKRLICTSHPQMISNHRMMQSASQQAMCPKKSHGGYIIIKGNISNHRKFQISDQNCQDILYIKYLQIVMNKSLLFQVNWKRLICTSDPPVKQENHTSTSEKAVNNMISMKQATKQPTRWRSG